METRETHDKHERKDDPRRTIIALFASRAEGREAIAALHKANYKHTWLGTTSLADTPRGETVTVESGGFFSGTQSLVEALVSRGVNGAAAHRLEGEIEPGNALLTLDPKDEDPAQALAIMQSYGGRVAGGEDGFGTTASIGGAGTRAVQTPLDDDVEWEEVIFYQR